MRQYKGIFCGVEQGWWRNRGRDLDGVLGRCLANRDVCAPNRWFDDAIYADSDSPALANLRGFVLLALQPLRDWGRLYLGDAELNG
jgi:hypothetical protein